MQKKSMVTIQSIQGPPPARLVIAAASLMKQMRMKAVHPERQVRYATNRELFNELMSRFRMNSGQFSGEDARQAKELSDKLNPEPIQR